MRTPLITFLLLLIISSVLWARDPREEKRIEHLLQTVESLKGAAFIRNGTEYNAKDAGKHLRMKLAKAGDRVKTAEDFIEGCAIAIILFRRCLQDSIARWNDHRDGFIFSSQASRV